LLRFLISIAVAWIASPAWGEKPAGVPRFESTPCSSFELNDKNADCGFLVVAENREDPGGRPLRLAVAVLKSRSADPEPDPVLRLHGGPGGSAISGASGATFTCFTSFSCPPTPIRPSRALGRPCRRI
jgi:hypothetical protein